VNAEIGQSTTVVHAPTPLSRMRMRMPTLRGSGVVTVVDPETVVCIQNRPFGKAMSIETSSASDAVKRVCGP
jgi:hypothetical protein